MARQVQIRRGTAAENDAFTGAIGEITMDTTNKTLRVHDGTTVGGTSLARTDQIPQRQNIEDLFCPSTTAETISVSASGDIYVATKNGWIQADCSASSTPWVRFTNTTRHMSKFSGWNGVADGVNTNMFVVAGDSIKIEYSGNYTFTFVPTTIDAE